MPTAKQLKKTAIVKIDSLQNWELNPRSIKEDRFKELKKRITEHGFNDVLKLAADGKTVIGGNMRLRALKELGFSEIEVLYTEASTPEQILRIALDDNEEFGQYEREALVELAYKLQMPLLELKEYKLHLSQPVSLADIIKEDTEEIVEDEAPEVDADNIVSKPGEVYQLGRHRLMCGDSLDLKQLELLMDGTKASLYLTDPPYGVDYGEVVKSRAHQKKKSVKDWGLIYKDELKDDKYKDWLTAIFTNAKEVLDINAAWYVWFGQQQQMYVQSALKDAANILTHRLIIWVKPSMVFGRGHYHWRHEACLYGWQQGNIPKTIPPPTETTVWELNAKKDNQHEHPTQKPNSLMARSIKNSSKEGEIVLDTFGGGGATLLASEQLDRTAYLMEIAPEFCDVIRRRYWKFINNDNEEGWQDGTPAITK